MRALVLRDFHDLAVEERPAPVPGADEVVLDVIATGICGSDVHGYTGQNGRRHPGQVMGHETVGRIAALGSAVTGLEPGLEIGRLATVNPVVSCGDCPACTAGHEQWCPSRVVIGVARDVSAAFADQLAAPARNVVVLPSAMPAELGALIEPLAVGQHAVNRGGPTPQDRVLIVGGGPIGQACLIAVRRAGIDAVAVSDISPNRRELCTRLGARVIDPTASPPADQVADVLGGPATLVLDAVGVDATVADAIAASGFGARIVLVGMGSPRLDLAAYAISTEERTLIGSFCYSAAEFRETAAWVGTAPAGIDQLIDGRVGWDGAAQAFADLAGGRSEASKILVFPGGVTSAVLGGVVSPP